VNLVTAASEPGDLYELLGVPPDASAAEITRAYHRRARTVHPDTQGGGEPASFRRLEEAYRVLHDPVRRAAYDQALRPPPAPPNAAPSAPPAPAPPPVTFMVRPGWPGRMPPGADLWAGPVQVTPPDADAPDDDAGDARLMTLADLLARYFGSARDWPW
jgi:curved DNA-binding protein CbpA